MTLSSSPWMVLSRVLSRFAWSYFKEQQPLLLLSLAFQMQRQDRFSIFMEKRFLWFHMISEFQLAHLPTWKDSNDMKFLFNPDARPEPKEPKKTLWSWIGIENDPPWACSIHAYWCIVYYFIIVLYCIIMILSIENWMAPYHRICK